MQKQHIFGLIPLLLTACNIDIDITPEDTGSSEAPQYVMNVDIDGDGEMEGVNTDSSQLPENTTVSRTDEDADFDEVTVGLSGGATLGNPVNIDGDNDTELVIYDPNLPPELSYGKDLDGDGDIDLLIIGTGAGGPMPIEPGGMDNYDKDPKGELEIIIYDENLPEGEVREYDLDVDGDPDLIIIGTGRVGSELPIVMTFDLEGDGELEVVKADSSLLPENTTVSRTDGDADFDEVTVGLSGGATLGEPINIDSDLDYELVIYDPNLPPELSYGIDLDGDRRFDLLIIGTGAGGPMPIEPGGMDNYDDDPKGELEIIIYDENLPEGEIAEYYLDDDNDVDLVIIGTGGYMEERY